MIRVGHAHQFGGYAQDGFFWKFRLPLPIFGFPVKHDET